MAETLRVGIAGGGWPGLAHAAAYQATSGFKLVAVADLIPARRKKLMDDYKIARQYADAMELVRDREIDVISVCLPSDLHGQIVNAALRAGKHVLCESPPAHLTKDAKAMQRSAESSGKVLMYAMQRRFGVHELAAKQAVDKGYIGQPYHVRTVWTRTRGIPAGTGWYTDKARSGGGVVMDIGLHMLDLAWSLLGQPKPTSAYALTHQRFADLAATPSNVEDAAFALLRFENGCSIELATSWAINQPPTQNGTACRIYGSEGAIEVYTRSGPVIYRKFDKEGNSKSQPLKGPKTAGHNALIRAFRDAIRGTTPSTPGPAEGVALMQMVDAIYKSAETGKSAGL